MDIKHIYEDPSILHEGTLKPRAVFKSYDNKTGELSERSLNGEWSFSFYDSVRKGRTALVNGSFRRDASSIAVPSTWQHKGYDRSQYINTRYPFPADPPFVPKENPMGIYERLISVTACELGGTVILRFDGVDSCFFLYVNEHYAGYSQVSHSVSEFDITALLSEGDNLITVVVLKWCDGSYLECQDKFRETGIFRDVDLLIRPKDYLFDHTVCAVLNEQLSEGKLTVTTDRVYDYEIMCELSYNGAPVAAGKPENGKAELSVSNPLLWNYEEPNLYTLKLITPYETIREQVGFRRIEIKNGIFYLNNVACKLRGVNYHDSNPYKGARLTKEQALEDLKLMKECNINAIRTSHYPKPHWFMEMCDTYGFAIIDEADIEAHGSSYIYYEGEREVSAVSRMPMFKEAFLDRIKLLYERDKNHPCVLLWSLGNESGYGENLIEGAKYLHSKHDMRPVHYEGADRNYRFELPTDEIDVYSNMYASVERVEDYCTNNPKRLSRPYMQCEFCHAMGNGPGDLYENVEQLYSYEHYFGAFVWEWCDHAVFKGIEPGGRERFLYGGDSGETYHDGNFCMDGLVFPNRKVHTGYYEYQNVIRPLRLVSFDRKASDAEFENMYDFADARQRLNIRYEIKENGTVLHAGELTEKDLIEKDFTDFTGVKTGSDIGSDAGVNAAAQKRKHYTAKLPYALKDSEYVIFRYETLGKYSLVEEGFELGRDEVLPLTVEKPEKQEKETGEELSLVSTDYEFIVSGNNFEYTFDRELGGFTKLTYRGSSLITRPVTFNILRAYTDNDRNVRNQWERFGYNDAGFYVHETAVVEGDDEIKITFAGSIAAPYRSPALTLKGSWSIKTSGELRLLLHADRNVYMEFLPRFGLRLFVPKSFNKVEYFGYGPKESYIDKHRSTLFDRFTQSIDELSEPYVKPQETGSHYGTHYLTVTGEKAGLHVFGSEPFSFNLSKYSAEAMNKAMHRDELIEEPDNVLCIDYKMSGVGSNSCGPELMKKYRLDEDTFTWKISLVPQGV